MADKIRVQISERNGVELEFHEEYILSADNIRMTDNDPQSITAKINTLSAANKSNSLMLHKHGKTKNAWMEYGQKAKMNESAWTPDGDIQLTYIMFTNKEDKNLTSITLKCYSDGYDNGGNISTTDTLEFTIANTDTGVVSGNDFQRWKLDLTSLNLTLNNSLRYAFQINANKDIEQVIVELHYIKI